MDLALHQAEYAVGAFSLDLIGVDLATGEKVIVENQLERSDHKHLGQLLTYAAGVDASIVIWVADSFREEHLSALRWLNTNTGSGIALIAVEVSVVRIDNSRKAPIFTVVERPNEWTRDVQARESASPGMDPYRAFWQQLLDFVSSEYPDWELPRKVPQKTWISFPGPGTGVSYHAIFKDDCLRVGLGVGTRNPATNAELHDLLRPMASEVTDASGQVAQWRGPQYVWQGYDLDIEQPLDLVTIMNGDTRLYISTICEYLSIFRSLVSQDQRLQVIRSVLQTKNLDSTSPS
jgi:hypothetical protein